MQNSNPIRRLREFMGMNQADFAKKVGRSHQSIGNYERGTARPPAEVICRLNALAAEYSLADITFELDEEDQTRAVFHRPEKFLCVQEPADIDRLREYWHVLLDAALDHNPVTAHAVVSVLRLFEHLVKGESHAPAGPDRSLPSDTARR